MANLIFKDHPVTWRTGHDFPEVPLTRISWDTAPDKAVAYVFFGHVNIDYDGSPTAYGPPGISPMPDDDLSSAGNNKDGWFGVVALEKTHPLVQNGSAKIDEKPWLLKKGKYPVVQQAKNGDPNPGYYVSGTPLQTGPSHLQNSYVDASQVSYGALSGGLRALGFNLGDYGLALRHDQNLNSGFYFVDIGGAYTLGECSHKVGKNLGGSGRAGHFNNNFPVSFILFPESFDIDPNEGTPSIPDDQIRQALIPLLRNLSMASNADELPLLMGFNETRPLTKPQGTSKLASYRQQPSRPRPANYNNIVQGLSQFGWTPLYTPTYTRALINWW
ncbi:MAG: hypothetical protein ACJ74W_20955 [Pyrinomonadaceae bacterium]